MFKYQKMEDYQLFLRRYEMRIQYLDDYSFTNEKAYKLFKEKGEDHFLQELEEKERYNNFCHEFYDILREQWNACGDLMWDEFNKMKEIGRENYIQSLRKRIKGFDRWYGHQFGIYSSSDDGYASDDESCSESDD
jgi:hypothetical protein